MAKTKLGLKRICPKCSAKYYDMGKNPPICPACGTEYSEKTGAAANQKNDEHDIDADNLDMGNDFDDELDDKFDVESDSNVLKEKKEEH